MSRLIIVVTVLLLSACTNRQVIPSQHIQGHWQSDLAGFTIKSTYLDGLVSVDSHAPIVYELDGDRLIIGGDALSLRIVSFPSDSEMIQLDPLTGTEQRYRRIQSDH